jgi:hypothetical protein
MSALMHYVDNSKTKLLVATLSLLIAATASASLLDASTGHPATRFTRGHITRLQPLIAGTTQQRQGAFDWLLNALAGGCKTHAGGAIC